MTKARHLRKPTASTNSEFAPICLARLALSEGGACNRTSSRLVTAGPRGVWSQPKSRRQAYRNHISWRPAGAAVARSQPKSRCQAYRNGNGLDEGGALRSRPNRSHAVRRIETASARSSSWPPFMTSQPKSRRQAYRNKTVSAQAKTLNTRCPNRSHAVRRIETDLRASPRRQVDSVPTEVTPSGEADASLNEHADSAIGTRSTKFV